jgi:hypothetical protein
MFSLDILTKAIFNISLFMHAVFPSSKGKLKPMCCFFKSAIRKPLIARHMHKIKHPVAGTHQEFFTGGR